MNGTQLRYGRNVYGRNEVYGTRGGDTMTSTAHGERVRRRLRVVRWIALVDAILLILLVSSALTGARGAVHILGPLHGVNFLILLVTAATAALDGLWGWWFPAVILVTAGPIGALAGERVIGRRITAGDDDRDAPAVGTGEAERGVRG